MTKQGRWVGGDDFQQSSAGVYVWGVGEEAGLLRKERIQTGTINFRREIVLLRAGTIRNFIFFITIGTHFSFFHIEHNFLTAPEKRREREKERERWEAHRLIRLASEANGSRA